ncbi:hypothetical protein GS539_29525 [Rhodococcus hoagii]|nr:hypothetical protein [Prescottella equi]
MNDALKKAVAEHEAAQDRLDALRAKRGIPDGVDPVIREGDNEYLEAVAAVHAAALKAATTPAGE